MAALARTTSTSRVRMLGRVEAEPVAAWLLGFVLVAYLGLKGGGYDPLVRGELGLAVWWVLLLAAITGVLGRHRWEAAPLVAVIALVAFAAWTALGISWAESSERGTAELARVATLTGVFLLALCVPGEQRLRHVTNGLLWGVALIAAVALLSRLRPDWIAGGETARFLPTTQSRLSHPLNYWNALGALMALGLPLALGASWHARTLWGQALSAAAVPLMVLTLTFTFSRGAAGAAAVGLLAYFVFAPGRVLRLATLAVTGFGSAVLIAGMTQRSALEDGLTNQAAVDQGSEMLLMLVLVCVGVALIQTAMALASRHAVWRPALGVSRATAIGAAGAASLVVVLALLAAGGPGWVADGWEDFKGNPASLEPTGDDARITRFDSASGNGRYQYWKGAVEANAEHPLRGIGPGGFEFWWAKNGTLDGLIRDAHSLYFETFAELGIGGLLILAVFLLTVLVAGSIRCLRAPRELRAPAAAALAACFAFCASAAVDWVWEVTVLPVAFLVLAAVLLRSTRAHEPVAAPRDSTGPRREALITRTAVVLLALVAIVAIAIPLAGASAVRDSQTAVSAGRLGPAFERAGEGERVQPSAASPRLQQALILEAAGSLGQAANAARAATSREPTNWRTWLVLSRIEAHRGNAASSVRAYRRARSLNPRSILFIR